MKSRKDMQTSQDRTDQAVLLIAFGGPECREDVRPFLTRVTKGRVPQERLEGVACHYDLFGGKSPVNEVTFAQADGLRQALESGGQPMPVYVGMRNWHPLLADTLKQMAEDGIRSAVGMIMSVFQSTSSWDQYQVEVSSALSSAGIDLRLTYTTPFFDRPGFIRTMAEHILDCRKEIPESHRDNAYIVFTAHSLPLSDPQVTLYEEQALYSATQIAHRLGCERWRIAYQSRSGRPQDPWLEPDVNDVLRELAQDGVTDVTIAPIGFVCDNVEVLYDLDVEARQTAQDEGIRLTRATTVGTDPEFMETMAEMVRESEKVSGGKV